MRVATTAQRDRHFAGYGFIISRTPRRPGYPLVWTERGWFHWAPYWAKNVAVAVWNRVNCALFGHDDVLVSIREAWHEDGPHCVNCCTVLPGGGREEMGR